MSVPLTSATETVKSFLYDTERELVGFVESQGQRVLAYYMAKGNVLEKSWTTYGGDIKRSKVVFDKPISLYYRPGPIPDLYTVNAFSRKNSVGMPIVVERADGVNGVIGNYSIRQDLIEDWKARLSG